MTQHIWHIVDISQAGFEVPADATFEKRQYLGPLATVNVIIGANNSGKSRLLRSIFAKPGGVMQVPGGTQALVDARESLKLVIGPHLHNAKSRTALTTALNERGWQPELTLSRLEAFLEASVGGLGFCLTGNAANLQECVLRLHELLNANSGLVTDSTAAAKALRRFASLLKEKMPSVEPAAAGVGYVYVPAMRGMRPLGTKTDLYAERTQRDFFAQGLGSGNRTIFSGVDLYDRLHALHAGPEHARDALARYEAFLTEWLFLGQPVRLTPVTGSDVVHIKIARERERPVYELGDGVQQVIIQTFPLFEHFDKPLVLCIEEPELFLHPGLQRVLLEAFLNGPFEKPVQVFMATHSSQFLDMTLDSDQVRVFASHKVVPADGRSVDATFVVAPCMAERRPVLEALGVRNSSVLLSNCTIWVEGITDRAYLRKYLSLYFESIGRDGGRVPREDVHYSFVEYSGSNIRHWSFLDKDTGIKEERLCGRLLLVADRDYGEDEPKVAKRQMHEKLSTVLGERFILLPCREIENLLSPKVLLQVVAEYEGASDAGSLGIAEPAWSEYKDQPLGTYIGTMLLKPPYVVKRRGEHPYGAGAIKDKTAFAHRAINRITSWSDLTEDARVIAETIGRFIMAHNKPS